MAALNGFLPTLVEYSGIVNANLSSDLMEFENLWWPPHQSAMGDAPNDVLSRAYVDDAARGIEGFKVGAYSDDFYHRIHIIPSRLDLGNMVGTQTSPLRIWNAFFTPQSIVEINGVNEGIELTGQDNPPLAFAPLQERAWDISITPDGPAVLDAELEFIFAAGSVATLNLTGNRITPFAWRVDWSEGVRERLTWATSIAQSSTGHEQRRALRVAPRRNLSAPVILHKRERQLFDLAMFGWASRVWAIPVWFDIQLLTTGVAAAAMAIPCDTVNRDFRANGLAILLGETAFQYETVEILSVTPTQLNLKRPLVQGWAVGSRIYPARTARLESAPQVKRKTDELQTTAVDFVMAEPCEWPAVAPTTTYRGYPVYDAVPNENEDLTSQLQHLLLQLDNGSAIPVVTDAANLSFLTTLHRWLLQGRSEHAAFRSLLYYLSGRQKAVWIPTHADDITLAAIVVNSATVMDIVNIGCARFGQLKTGRRDIRLQLRNGTVFYRRITGAIEISTDVERVQIDTAFGVQINPADVLRISWLMLMRGDSDVIEINHVTDADGVTEAQQIFRSVRDDV